MITKISYSLSILLFITLFILPFTSYAKVWELSNKNFDQVINGENHALVVFHSPESAHSAKLQPEFEFTADEIFSEEDGVIFGRVNCVSEPEFVHRFDVEGFPVLKWFPKGSTNDEPFYLVHYEGRLAKTLTKLVNDRTGLKKVVPRERTPINDVSQAQWDTNLSKNKYTVVLFMLPWCIECDVIKTNFEIAARAFQDEPDITFANFEVSTKNEREITERYSVGKFPTIVLFEPNDEPYHIPEITSIEELVEIVNGITNTFRTVRGELKPQVCIVEELNDIVISNPKITDEVINKAREVLETLSGRDRNNGENYIKIMEKIKESGPKYIYTEMKRLEKLLKVGSSAKADKKTLFSIRKNILEVFKAAHENSPHSDL